MDQLVDAARQAQSAAHAPYSDYSVGAAIEASSGEVFTGCNIEIVNFSNSLHAEEVAIAEALKNGHREFDRIAVSSAARDGVTPCGMCRQTLAEFCSGDFPILCDEGDSRTEYTLGELLPATMSTDMLDE